MLKFLPRAHFQSFYRCFTELNVCSVHICLSPAGTLPNLLCEEPWTLSFFLFLMPSDCCSSGLTKWAWRLTHAIMEVEKSQDLQSPGYTPRRADGISSSWKAEEAQCPSSAVRMAGFALTQALCSIRSSVGHMRPTHTGEGNLPYSVYQFKCYSHSETPSQTHPESCLTKYLGTPWFSQADALH